MQAIVTKFIPCTNTRGSRIKAIADAGSVTISAPAELNIEDGHTLAAVMLARKFGWIGDGYGTTMMRGGMPQASPYAYVFVHSGGKSVEWETVDMTDSRWGAK